MSRIQVRECLHSVLSADYALIGTFGTFFLTKYKQRIKKNVFNFLDSFLYIKILLFLKR